MSKVLTFVPANNPSIRVTLLVFQFPTSNLLTAESQKTLDIFVVLEVSHLLTSKFFNDNVPQKALLISIILLVFHLLTSISFRLSTESNIPLISLTLDKSQSLTSTLVSFFILAKTVLIFVILEVFQLLSFKVVIFVFKNKLEMSFALLVSIFSVSICSNNGSSYPLEVYEFANKPEEY